MHILTSAFCACGPKENQISLGAILIAYATILIGIPLFSALNLGIYLGASSLLSFVPFLGPILETAFRPVFHLFFALTFSPLFAWMGALVSLPLVFLARRFGLFGWASALLAGALAFQISWCWVIQKELVWSSTAQFSSEWIFGMSGTLILSFTFWAIIWLSTNRPRRVGF